MTKKSTRSSSALLAMMLAVAVGGCGESPMPRDAATMGASDAATDAGPMVTDAGPMGMDAGPIHGDAAMADTGTTPTDPLVRCQALAAQVSDACSESDRECGWMELGELCATERVDVLIGSFECMRAESTSSCRTYPDPSAARDCVLASDARFDAAHAREVAGHIATACAGDARYGDAESLIHFGFVPLAALGDTSLDAIDVCVAGASSCGAAQTCYRAVFAAFVACYER